jgi:hypothetical protein
MAAGVARPESSTSRILVVFAVILLGIIGFFIAPMFLPMWRWRNLDFHQLATDKKVDEGLLKQEYLVKFRYAPRGNNDEDPCPFQILTMTPAWNSFEPDKRENEDHLLVRCTVISDKTGAPPSALIIGGSYKDRYFTAKCWRLPPGSFGKPSGRPVLLYRSLTLDKVSYGDADMLDTELRRGGNWESDDLWEDRDDGWDPIRAAEEAAEKARKAAEAADAGGEAPK